jgi:hypothetical protein
LIIEKLSTFPMKVRAISGDLSVERSLTIITSHSPAYIWAFRAFKAFSMNISSFRIGIIMETDGNAGALR